jgi:Tfp pilus assembly PilM family ATPase
MARSCGIRIGPRRFELVVLDGSARKHRLTAFTTGEYLPGDEADAVAALKDAVRAHNVPLDSISIAVDSGLAAFRSLRMPMTDDAKIEEVLKFEVEGELPQWSIDDVIVDFVVQERTEHESRILVTALQKRDLRGVLDVCTDAGFEPQEAEIEATAMINAAPSADVCHEDDAQVLVHIGEVSTAVCVMDGGRLKSMRAIHIGALTHDPGPVFAEPPESPTGTDPLAEPPEPVELPVDEEELQRRLEQAVSRIRRELGRTLSAARTEHPIEAIYVCGWELPNLVETTVHDVPVYELDVFEADSGQPAEGTAPLVVAYGVALRQLGGGRVTGRLRREELRFTGTLERIELPLAVAGLMLVTLLGVFVIFQQKLYERRVQDVDLWLMSAVNFMYGDAGSARNLEYPWPEIKSYVEKVREAPELLEHTREEQLSQLKRMIELQAGKLNEDLGNDLGAANLGQPQSAFEALTLVLAAGTGLGDDVGRMAIRRASARTLGATATGSESVEIRLDLAFFADDVIEATGNYEAFRRALDEQVWTTAVTARGTGEFPDGKGIFTDDLRIVCDLSLVPDPEGQVANS